MTVASYLLRKRRCQILGGQIVIGCSSTRFLAWRRPWAIIFWSILLVARITHTNLQFSMDEYTVPWLIHYSFDRGSHKNTAPSKIRDRYWTKENWQDYRMSECISNVKSPTVKLSVQQLSANGHNKLKAAANTIRAVP